MDFFAQFPLQNDTFIKVFNIVRIIFVILDIALLWVFLYSMREGLKYRPPMKPEGKRKKQILTLRNVVIEDRWRLIVKKFDTASPDTMRIAIIEADALADEVLKQMGMPGEHMADRLENLSSEDLPSLDRLWRAHKIRNNLVHSPGFEISGNEAQRTIEDYTAFLKEVGIIQ